MSLTNNKKFYNSLVKKMQINEGDIVYLASNLIKIILYFKILFLFHKFDYMPFSKNTIFQK